MPEPTPAVSAKEFKMCNVQVGGDKIVIPDGMTPKEAIDWIKRHEEESERVIAISELVEAFPTDGAHALTKALSQKYGWTSLIPTPGFFGDRPPAMIGVPTDAKGGTCQVPWGRIQIPKVAGYIQTSAIIKDGRWLFMITGEVKRKNEPEVKQIADLTRQLVKDESLYKGKAIKMNFVDADPNAGFNPHQETPSFIDCSQINEAELVLNADVRAQIDTAVLTPIEHTAKCRAHKIPLKRGILLEGPYGTGKSLTAYLTAKYAEKHGWTFIYLNTVAQLQKAIFFAKQYAPAVVFAEDIDRVVAGERTVEIDSILNTIDGIDTKGAEIITVLTTNHIEQINPAMLRPGRLDAIITFKRPDAKSVAQLIRQYGREMVPSDLEFDEICEKMADQIPSVIREMVERAKLASIRRDTNNAEVLRINVNDLSIAADSMLQHVEFMKARKFDARSTPLGAVLEIVGDSLGSALGKNLQAAEIGKTLLNIKAEQEKEARGNGAHAKVVR